MKYFVYLIVSTQAKYKNGISYVGYTNDLQKRLNKHNTNLGARSTKGYKWEIVYKKRFYSKNKALSFEYTLKKDRNERLRLLNDFKKKI